MSQVESLPKFPKSRWLTWCYPPNRARKYGEHALPNPPNISQFSWTDLVYIYRLYGLGHGFTKPGPGAILEQFQSLISVTAINKYTVVFKWKEPNQEIMKESIQETGCVHAIEACEAVEKWGDLGDWHHAIGTGPFILKDFVPGRGQPWSRIPTTGAMTNVTHRTSFRT